MVVSRPRPTSAKDSAIGGNLACICADGAAPGFCTRWIREKGCAQGRNRTCARIGVNIGYRYVYGQCAVQPVLCDVRFQNPGEDIHSSDVASSSTRAAHRHVSSSARCRLFISRVGRLSRVPRASPLVPQDSYLGLNLVFGVQTMARRCDKPIDSSAWEPQIGSSFVFQ